MKTKNLFLATMMAMFTLGITGCDKNEDRLFDDKELIEEPKDDGTKDNDVPSEEPTEPEKPEDEEEKEVDYEKEYPLTKKEYEVRVVTEFEEILFSDPDFDVNYGIPPRRLQPKFVDFLKNSKNLRGYMYRRAWGKEVFLKREALIMELLELRKDSRYAVEVTTGVIQTDYMCKNYRIYLDDGKGMNSNQLLINFRAPLEEDKYDKFVQHVLCIKNGREI